MRKIITMVLLSMLFLVPFHVKALGDIHIGSLDVDIWPEYDQPAVLMIYRITLAPDTTLPASLSIHIPSNARINAVAVVDPSAGLLNIPYDTTIEGQWSALVVTTDSLQVQIEYYVALEKNATTRHITFEWGGDYSVDKLVVNFLRPFGAENVSISQAPVETSPGQDGLTNYRVQAASLPADKTYSLTIDYQRNTDDLSISSLPVQAVSTPGPDTPGRVSINSVLPWVLAGIGFILIVAGIVGFIFWQHGGQPTGKDKRHKTHHEQHEEDFRYCHQCGNRAQPGDVFCRTCGTRLKKNNSD